jgi:hypothetical protein
MELKPLELLRIINGYAIQGANSEQLADLYEKLDVTNLLNIENNNIKEKERSKEKENEYKNIHTKILKIISGEKEKTKNITQDLRDYIDLTDGVFSLHECYSAIGANEPKEKSIVRKTISIMVSKKELESVGIKTGNYLKINKNIEVTDFKNLKGLGEPLVFDTPMNVGNRTIFFPHSLWGIAGVTGNGKTTFAFNIIRNVQNKFETVYFYEAELGPEALSHKLGYFQCPISSWNFKAICSSNSMGLVQWDHTNIHHMIHPNAINIIDYLEPPENEPWKIYHVMKRIAAALSGGMAIILIQKKEGSKFGVGGDWSAKATSFYTSLEWGILKIEKNSYQQEDKVGRDFKCRDFKIGVGSHVEELSGWYSEESKKQTDKIKQYAEFGIGSDKDFPHET